jgi:DNA-directed RNA polymerase sigma subunit (sigma70/sigma32)
MHISKEFSRYSRAIQEYKNHHGKEPEIGDLKSSTHLDGERLELLARIPRDFISTQTPIGSSDREIGDMLPDENAANQPTEEAVKNDLMDALKKLMSALSEKEFSISGALRPRDAEPMVPSARKHARERAQIRRAQENEESRDEIRTQDVPG